MIAMSAVGLVGTRGSDGMSALPWRISIGRYDLIERDDGHSPERSGLNIHGWLAATDCEIHPEVCYSLVEGVPGN